MPDFFNSAIPSGNASTLPCVFSPVGYSSDKVGYPNYKPGDDDGRKCKHGVSGLLTRSAPIPIPAFVGGLPADLREQMTKAVKAWMLRTPSPHTRRAYESDLDQFLAHAGIEAGAWEQLAAVRPEHVAAWRDAADADAGRPTAPSAAS